MPHQNGNAGDANIDANGASWGFVVPTSPGEALPAWPTQPLQHPCVEPVVALDAAPVPPLHEPDAKAGHVSHPVDVHVGARVRLRRQLLGLNQKELAASLGLSFQQVQKFERGKDRIAASRLYEIANVLNVPISFFFDAIPSEAPGQAERVDDLPPSEAGEERLKEALNLMRAYRNVRDPALRKRLLDLVRSMG